MLLKKLKSNENLVNKFIIHTQCFTVILESSNTDFVEYRVIVPKKNIKKAVQRNRVKRQLKDIIKNFSKTTKISVRIVIIAKSSSYEKSYAQLCKDFNYAIYKYKKNR